MPRTRNETQYAAHKQKIIDDAARVFSISGYHNTTLDDVAAEVGVTKAALYYYFPNKEEILLQICEATMDSILADISRIFEDESLTFGARIRLILRQLLETMDANLDAFTVFLQEPSQPDHPRAAAVRAKQRKYSAYVEELIAAGIDSGELRPMSPRLATFALLGMCNWSFRWMRAENTSPDKIADGFFDLISMGLVIQSPLK